MEVAVDELGLEETEKTIMKKGKNGIPAFKDVAHLFNDDMAAADLLANYGVFDNDVKCPECGCDSMNPFDRDGNRRTSLMCNAKGCRAKCQLARNSFFW